MNIHTLTCFAALCSLATCVAGHRLTETAPAQQYDVASTATASTCASVERRVDCGYVDIPADECSARGCCYEKQTGSPSCYYPAEGVETEKVILVVSNHFDAGYTMPVNDVVGLYHFVYFPLAASVGAALEANKSTSASLRWMTQSWLVDLFFHCPEGNNTAARVYNITCPTPEQQATVREAIEKGWITYHAFPHNGDLELATASQLEFGVNMTHQLDDELGLPRKTVLSQRDVPGFPRAALPALNAAGVDVLSEGSNSAMNPPNVPPVFLWTDNATGAEAIVEWHALGYGQLPKSQHGSAYNKDYLRLPGCPTVLLYGWRNDNEGPPSSAAEVIQYFEEAQAMFPGAEVVAGTLEDYASVLRQHKDSLIRVSGEIGDTWLMSAASDAKKLGKVRALQRASDACVAEGACTASDDAFTRFRKRFLKSFEHTLGLHVNALGRLLSSGWSNEEFYAQRRAGDPDLQQNPQSWARQEAWVIDAPLAELPQGHPLLERCQEELRALQPVEPSPATQGYERLPTLGTTLSGLGPGGRLTMRFDPSNAAIAELVDTVSGTVWANASADGNSSLGLIRYQTLTQADWAVFREAYIYTFTDTSWAERTYGKPNMSSANPEHQLVAPTMQELWVRRGASTSSVAVRASFQPELHTKYGCPTEVWLSYNVFAAGDGAVALNLTVFAANKSSTRLSEAAWITFNPAPGASKLVPRRLLADFHDDEHSSHHHHHHHHHHHDDESDHHHHEESDHHHGAGTPPPRRRLHAAAPPAEMGSPRWHRARDAIRQAREAAVAGTPPHLRVFQRPYHADAHYEWAAHPDVRDAAGACEGCRFGRRRLLVHETDRTAYGGWSINKFGEWQSPVDGVRYSGRSVQAAAGGVRYAPPAVNGTLQLSSMDAPIIRFGPVTPFPLPMPGAPSVSGGVSFTLWSNSLINTNVPFWQPWAPGEFEADFAWRFSLRLE